MKTTIELPDALMEEARRVANERGCTLKALMEAGLRRVIEEQPASRRPFKWRRRHVDGEGLHPELADADWSEIRTLIYEGRGG